MTMSLLVRMTCDRCAAEQVIDPLTAKSVEAEGWTQGSRDLCPECLRYLEVVLQPAGAVR